MPLVIACPDIPPIKSDKRLPETLGSNITGTESLLTFLGFNLEIALAAAFSPIFFGLSQYPTELSQF